MNKLIEERAESLKKLRNKIDTTKIKAPSFIVKYGFCNEAIYAQNAAVFPKEIKEREHTADKLCYNQVNCSKGSFTGKV